MTATPTNILTIIRPAELGDLNALLMLEQSVFDFDRMSARQYRYHLRPNALAQIWVASNARQQVLGSAVLLLRSKSQSGRIYSIAVAEQARGLGIAKQLIAQLEQSAKQAGCVQMTLEVHINNVAAQRLYLNHGYQEHKRKADYYQDGGSAICMRKSLAQ